MRPPPNSEQPMWCGLSRHQGIHQRDQSEEQEHNLRQQSKAGREKAIAPTTSGKPWPGHLYDLRPPPSACLTKIPPEPPTTFQSCGSSSLARPSPPSAPLSPLLLLEAGGRLVRERPALLLLLLVLLHSIGRDPQLSRLHKLLSTKIKGTWLVPSIAFLRMSKTIVSTVENHWIKGTWSVQSIAFLRMAMTDDDDDDDVESRLSEASPRRSRPTGPRTPPPPTATGCG
jgi:hypothetical protein